MGSGSSSRGAQTHEDEPVEAAHVEPACANALVEHYERFFGAQNIIVYHERKSLGVHVDLYIYPPTEDRPFITAATIGMSALPLEESGLCEHCREHGNVLKHRTELLMYLDPNWDFDGFVGWYPLLMMAFVARAPHLEDFSIGSGISYEFPEDLIVEGSLLTNGYIIKPWFENLDGNNWKEFSDIALPNGDVCNLYWLVPITTVECYVKRSKGTGALNELLIDKDYFLFDIDRECYASYENRAQRRAREKAQRTRAKRRPHRSVNDLICMGCGHNNEQHA